MRAHLIELIKWNWLREETQSTTATFRWSCIFKKKRYMFFEMHTQISHMYNSNSEKKKERKLSSCHPKQIRIRFLINSNWNFFNARLTMDFPLGLRKQNQIIKPIIGWMRLRFIITNWKIMRRYNFILSSLHSVNSFERVRNGFVPWTLLSVRAQWKNIAVIPLAHTHTRSFI